jgi:hypothetical protein
MMCWGGISWGNRFYPLRVLLWFGGVLVGGYRCLLGLLLGLLRLGISLMSSCMACDTGVCCLLFAVDRL